MAKQTKATTTKPKGKKVEATSSKRPVGRPHRIFTDEQINQMGNYALAGCQNNTIAGLMGVPKETIVDNFRQFLWEKRCQRKLTLRKQQNKAAKAGVPSLLIFLGKNDLEQTDQHTADVNLHISDLATFLKAMKE